MYFWKCSFSEDKYEKWYHKSGKQEISPIYFDGCHHMKIKILKGIEKMKIESSKIL